MKECPHCGTRQSDDRTTCVDCGTFLPAVMTEQEESAADAAIEAAIDHGADPTDGFAVTPLHRILGIAAILAVVAMLVLIGIANHRLQVYLEPPGIDSSVPDIPSITFEDGGTHVTFPQDLNNAQQVRHYRDITTCALWGALCFALASVQLLCPRLIWLLDTRRKRYFVASIPGVELLPSRSWVIGYRILCYFSLVLGGIGAAAVVWGLFF